MSQFDLIAMTYDSAEQIASILLLEEQCKKFDNINISAGIDHLSKKGGDHALLCYQAGELIGLLIWYTSDGIVANINGMVHPDYRRQGVFSRLLHRVKKEIQIQGLQTICYRVLSDSLSGRGYVQYLGATFSRSEYSMTLIPKIQNANTHDSDDSEGSDLYIRLEQTEDFEFLVSCLSLAFGDPESWTREYIARTNEPTRKTYIVWKNNRSVGLIRINFINQSTAIIHDFCVLPAHQGKGIGLEILSKTVSFLLDELRMAYIKLGVVTENTRALNLYHKAGFEVTCEYQYYVSDC